MKWFCPIWRVWVAFAIIAGLMGGFAPRAAAQSLLAGESGGPALLGTDLAVFESREIRKDLPCEVVSNKAQLGFDLKFHSGFEVSVPLRDLAGDSNLLTILFRVERQDTKATEPIFFIQKINVPKIEENARGEAYLQGSFDLGEGKYHVDWLMRDRSERVCANNWDLDANLTAKDRALVLHIHAGAIQPTDQEPFTDDPPVQRLNTEPMNVKVLINFAPQNAHASSLQPIDTTALVSILRCISREPRLTRFTVVAFNLQEQKVLYRQEEADRIDFPAIGKALEGVQLGRVNISKLSNKNSETEFLSKLIRDELSRPNEHPDALIFAGPKVMLDQPVPQDTLRSVGELEYPVFYMNYNLYPQQTPWRDSISSAVKFFKGTEYTISRPRDLWFAVTEMVQKIVKSRSGRRLQPVGLN